jgi:prepilin-type N-terminal cleavage/methylation domain-containing protein
MKPGRVTRPGGRGFTLVEIMVVVGILAIVLALGAPPFIQRLKKEPLRQAISDLQDGLDHARAQAILQGVTTEFVLNSTSGAMSVRPAPERDATTPGAMAEPTASAETPFATTTGTDAGASMPPFSARLHPEIRPELVELNLQSQMQAEEVRVRFHPNGTSDDFTIVLRYRGEMRKVFLDPVTALANLEVLR